MGPSLSSSIVRVEGSVYVLRDHLLISLTHLYVIPTSLFHPCTSSYQRQEWSVRFGAEVLRMLSSQPGRLPKEGSLQRRAADRFGWKAFQPVPHNQRRDHVLLQIAPPGFELPHPTSAAMSASPRSRNRLPYSNQICSLHIESLPERTYQR